MFIENKYSRWYFSIITDEHRAKLSTAHKGKILTDGHKAKISEGFARRREILKGQW